MNTKPLLALALLTMVLPSLSIAEETSFSWQAKEINVVLEGDSTLHHYASTATTVNVQAEFSSDQLNKSPQALAAELVSLTVSIPVDGLESGKNGLDKNMAKELKADKHPDIVFELDQASGQSGSDSIWESKGRLTVAGVEKPVILTSTAAVSSEGLRITGEKDLLMSDFEINPPKMFLGALKTDDKILIRYNLLLTPSK